MYIDINELPTSSKVWIYQADRFLNNDEISLVEASLKHFVDSWLTHSMLMKGSFKVLNNRILVIAADNGFQDASGCSIDSMTRWLKKLGNEIGTEFFDRSIGYFKDKELYFCPFFEVKKYIAKGEITNETLVVNQQVSTIAELNSSFNIQTKDSFLKRHFAIVTNP